MLQLRLERVDRRNPREEALDVTLVLGAEDLLQDEINHARQPLYRRGSRAPRSQETRGRDRSSRAWRSASLVASPPSIRATSATRSSPVRAVVLTRVRPARTLLATRRC